MPQTSKEERAQWAELCARATPLPWTHDTTDSFAKIARTALPRLLADFDELERKVRELETAVRDALYAKDTSVLGNGHCIKSRAHSIELWHKDPNCDVPKAAREIQDLQTRTHQTLVALADKVLPARAAVEGEK